MGPGDSEDSLYKRCCDRFSQSSLVTDASNGETVCGCCGTVHSERANFQAGDGTGRLPDTREGLGKMIQNQKPSHNFLLNGTYIFDTSKDAAGKAIKSEVRNMMERLKVLNNRILVNSRDLARFQIYEDFMNTNLNKANITKPEIVNIVYQNVWNIVRSRNSKGKSVPSMSAAIVYETMRQMGAGLTISKISDDFGLDIKKKKLAARYHRNIVGPFFSDKGSYVGATPNKLLNLLKDMYSLSPVENNQLISKTNNLLDMDEIKANPDFTGRDPATMLGGAAYLVIRNWDYRKVVYEKDLAEKIGKTNVSIGKAYKSLDTFLKQKGYDVRSLVKFL